MSDVAGTSFAPPKVIAFLQTLNHDTDLVAVLRGHLYVERLLTAVIETTYAGAEPVIRWLDFMRKVNIARENRLIGGPDKTALMAIGHVRDSFAHLPIKETLTPEDDATIQKAMPGLMESRAYAVFLGPMTANYDGMRSGLIVRAGIGMLYERMSKRLAEACRGARDGGPPRGREAAE